MGSPPLPLPFVANLYIEVFQNKAITTASAQPSLWVWFVDDTFVLLPHELYTLEVFHAHLNQIHLNIQFTKEMESDILVKRNYHGYQTRKATNKDLYTHFTSHHHPSVKTGTIKCLKRRAEQCYVMIRNEQRNYST